MLNEVHALTSDSGVDHNFEALRFWKGREMTRVAMRHAAINLSQGFPDFAAPEILKKAAADAIFADVNRLRLLSSPENRPGRPGKIEHLICV